MFIEKENEDGGYPLRIRQGSDLKIAQEKFPILGYLLRADVRKHGDRLLERGEGCKTSLVRHLSFCTFRYRGGSDRGRRRG